MPHLWRLKISYMIFTKVQNHMQFVKEFPFKLKRKEGGETEFGIHRDNLGNKVLTSDDQTLNQNVLDYTKEKGK